MRLSSAFFLFLPSVFAVLDVETIRPEDIYLPSIQGASSCFEGSENPSICLARFIRNACPDNQRGRNYVDLSCLRTNIMKMCQKQYDSQMGDYDGCVKRFHLASLVVTRDQCPAEADVFSCYLHEAYVLCDGKFGCVSDSLKKICSDGCISWQKTTYLMGKLKDCDGNLDCIDRDVKEGCGRDLDCAVPVISLFCELVNENNKESTRCLSMIYNRITGKEQDLSRGPPPSKPTNGNTTTRKPTTPVKYSVGVLVPEPEPQPPFVPVPSPPEAPSFPVPSPPEHPTWPMEEPNAPVRWAPHLYPPRPSEPLIKPAEPNVDISEDTTTVIPEESNATTTKWDKSTEASSMAEIQKYHVIIICVVIGVIILIGVVLFGWLFWKIRRDYKKRQEMIHAEKAAKVKKAQTSNRKGMSKMETSRTETSMKEASKSEASRKETDKSVRKEEKTEKSTGSKE